MPNYGTPEPISVTVDVSVANLRIAASDRTDTVVDVRPCDDSDESDVQAAAQVRVDYANGMLQITGPKRRFDFSKRPRSAEVSIELPSGSQLSAHLQLGEIRIAGRLGDCRLKTTGNVWLEQTGPLRLHTGFGHVTADRIAGDGEISTGSGTIQIGEVDGAALVKNSNGDILIDAVTGDTRVRTANGDISIDRAGAGVEAKTANGALRLGEVVRSSVVLATGAGNVDIGVARGTAAWLDVSTGFGHVRNLLENATRPEEADETVEVRGRTGYGDVTIHRS
jgi:DUF4097 and DUF4098 domain-containing protein YvlB